MSRIRRGSNVLKSMPRHRGSCCGRWCPGHTALPRKGPTPSRRWHPRGSSGRRLRARCKWPKSSPCWTRSTPQRRAPCTRRWTTRWMRRTTLRGKHSLWPCKSPRDKSSPRYTGHHNSPTIAPKRQGRICPDCMAQCTWGRRGQWLRRRCRNCSGLCRCLLVNQRSRRRSRRGSPKSSQMTGSSSRHSTRRTR